VGASGDVEERSPFFPFAGQGQLLGRGERMIDGDFLFWDFFSRRA
jgi:hypothetical protein